MVQILYNQNWCIFTQSLVCVPLPIAEVLNEKYDVHLLYRMNSLLWVHYIVQYIRLH